jgi:cytidine deaminase
VENGAYGSSICAERTAICKAVSEGHLNFKAIAIVGYQENDFTFPCGACRQFIAEFAKNDIAIYVAKPSPTRVFISSIYKLLPHSFQPKFLETSK